MQDILRTQAEIIDRGRQINFPLNQPVRLLEIPTILYSASDNVSFHELDLGVNDLWLMVPQVTISDDYEFLKAMVIKREGKPMVALCRGIDAHDLPIAAIFNLTDPNSNQVQVGTSKREYHSLENNHEPAGGLGISRLLRTKDPGIQNGLVEIISGDSFFSIDIL